MPNLDLKVPNNLLSQKAENGDEVLAAISKCQNHPCMKTIVQKCNFSFSLKAVSLTDTEMEKENEEIKHPIHLIFLQKFYSRT